LFPAIIHQHCCCVPNTLRICFTSHSVYTTYFFPYSMLSFYAFWRLKYFSLLRYYACLLLFHFVYTSFPMQFFTCLSVYTAYFFPIQCFLLRYFVGFSVILLSQTCYSKLTKGICSKKLKKGICSLISALVFFFWQLLLLLSCMLIVFVVIILSISFALQILHFFVIYRQNYGSHS